MADRPRFDLHNAIRNMLAYFAPAHPPVTEHIPKTTEVHKPDGRMGWARPRTVGLFMRRLRSHETPRSDYVQLKRLCRRLEGKRKGGVGLHEMTRARYNRFRTAIGFPTGDTLGLLRTFGPGVVMGAMI